MGGCVRGRGPYTFGGGIGFGGRISGGGGDVAVEVLGEVMMLRFDKVGELRLGFYGWASPRNVFAKSPARRVGASALVDSS